MPRALITGASGFVGVNLVETLLARGWEVDALVRSRSNLGYLSRFSGTGGARLLEGDILDTDLAERVATGLDCVFHLAGDTSFWRRQRRAQHRTNVEGTRNMVRLARVRRARRLVFTSTAGAFGLQRERLHEDSPHRGARSRIGYVRSKALAEAEVLAARGALDVVILNPTTIIGRYDHKLWPRVFRKVKDGDLPGVSAGRTSFCDVRAVAAAHVAAAEQGRPGARYLLGGPDASFHEVVVRIAALVGGRAPRRPVPALAMRAAGVLGDLWGTVSRAEPLVTSAGATYLLRRNRVCSRRAMRELGYRPPTLDRTLGDLHRWLQDEGLLP